MMKKIFFVLSIFLLIFSTSISAFADDYISPYPDKNSWFDRYNAWEYTANWASSFNPEYKSFANWYTGDSSSFASQCLAYGNMENYYYINLPYTDQNQWFYIHSGDDVNYDVYCHSWYVAPYFRKHWGNKDGVGKNRSYRVKGYGTAQQALNDYQFLFNNLWEGDCMQILAADKNAVHTTVFNEWGTANNPYGWEMYYAQHSTSPNFGQGLYEKLLWYANNASSCPRSFVFYFIKNGG